MKEKFVTSATNSISNLCVCVFKMEEEEGFEPPRGMTRLSVFKTDPFSQTWVFLRSTRTNLSWLKNKVNIFHYIFIKNITSYSMSKY